ncbi:Uncharacterised protein [Enterococcus malodoratus]|nr:Uncharacterised protein [Enterococcus malodoratus]
MLSEIIILQSKGEKANVKIKCNYSLLLDKHRSSFA